MKEKNMEERQYCYDTYKLERKEQINYFIIAVLSLMFIGYVYYANYFISFCMGLLAFPLKKYYIRFKIEKRREVLRIQFKDLLYSLSASISAGRQMSTALMESKQNLAFMYDESQPIMIEISNMSTKISESRVSDEILLKDFGYRSGIEEIIEFADMYSTCRATGADVNSIISKSAQVLTDKMTIDREIKTIISQKKSEAQIISMMPIIIIVFLNIASPGYLDCVYSTLTGKLIMTTALLLISTSYIMMKKIVDIKV
ncbi:MAG: type II secretion system F family protein [Aminipila sp.]